jgi:hypothetical protein
MPELEELMRAPLAPGAMRILYCKVCGAITYIRMHGNGEGVGDPEAHNGWHERRGDLDD